MRMVNIGFNVKTSDAVTDLKKFQSELIEIQKLVTDINKKSLDLKIDKNYHLGKVHRNNLFLTM